MSNVNSKESLGNDMPGLTRTAGIPVRHGNSLVLHAKKASVQCLCSIIGGWVSVLQGAGAAGRAMLIWAADLPPRAGPCKD